jgi:hypothetical protein
MNWESIFGGTLLVWSLLFFILGVRLMSSRMREFDNKSVRSPNLVPKMRIGPAALLIGISVTALMVGIVFLATSMS